MVPEQIMAVAAGRYRAEDLTATGAPGPLQELLNRVGAQTATLRRSIDRVWENQSIETCDDWVIPYIGDLLATRLVSCLDARAQRLGCGPRPSTTADGQGRSGCWRSWSQTRRARRARGGVFPTIGSHAPRVRSPIGNAFAADAAPWTADTTYGAGDIVANGANAYACVAGGISGTAGGPTGGGVSITDGGVI